MVCVHFMLVITPDLSFFCWTLLNQSINLCLHCLHSSLWWLFSSQMQWIRFIAGDRLVVDELLADVLFSSAVYLVFQTSQHTLPRVKHFIKLRVRGVCTIQQQPYSFSKLLCLRCTYHSTTVWEKPYSFSKLLCLQRMYHSTTVWGKPYSFSKLSYVPFSNSVGQTVFFQYTFVRTIQQRCGVNCILSVYFCKRDVHTHSATVWGKLFLFSKFSWTWHTYHSWLYWGSLRLESLGYLTMETLVT